MKRSFFSLLIILSFLSVSVPAKADPKPWPFSWGPGGDRTDYTPYMNDPQYPFNSQWERKNWRAEDWIKQRKSGLWLVEGFYRADILRDQDERQGVPALVVGPAFYQLGGEDKRRVVATVDKVYGVTKDHPNGMFMLYDWSTKQPIGSYTRHGLQLQ